MYTSPVDRGYTTRWHPIASSAQNNAAGSFATAADASYSIETDFTPVIGTSTSNHSDARVDHGPIATTHTSAGMTVISPVSSSRTSTPTTRVRIRVGVVGIARGPRDGLGDDRLGAGDAHGLFVESRGEFGGVTCAVASSMTRRAPRRRRATTLAGAGRITRTAGDGEGRDCGRCGVGTRRGTRGGRKTRGGGSGDPAVHRRRGTTIYRCGGGDRRRSTIVLGTPRLER